MKIDLRGNIKSVGSVFATASVSRNYDRRLVQRLITVETDEPWRRGRGWGVLLAPRLVVGIGTWRVHEDSDVVMAREASEMAHQIPEWRTAFTLSMREEPLDDDSEPWTIIPMEDVA